MLEIFGLAERLEVNGENYYRESVKLFKEPSLVFLFEWLADAERQHLEWFCRKRSELGPKAEDGDPGAAEADLLRDILGDQTFSLREVDLSTIKDTQALVDHALEFENDTILFYEVIRSLLENTETMNRLDEIIAEERSHIEKLRKYRMNKES